MRILLLAILMLCGFNADSQSCRKTTVYFGNGKDELKKDQLLLVDSVFSSLHPDTTYLVEVHGHTDDRGSEEANMKLCKRRVESVRTKFREFTNLNVREIDLYFGELSPASSDRKLNRRASIYVHPINADGTITIIGDNNVQMRVPAGYFRGCGFCLSNPSLETVKPNDNLSEGSISVNIGTNCTYDVECISVEFRFPFDFFNSNEEVKIPRPVYVQSCGNPSRRADSTDVKTDKRFNVRYDSLSNEYVVTHDCYNPYSTICCGTRAVPIRYKVILPRLIENKKTTYLLKYLRKDSLGSLQEHHTTKIETRDTFFVQGGDSLFGYGFFQGELLFLKASINDCVVKTVYTDKGFYDYTLCQIKLRDYAPLNFLDTTVRIKLPFGKYKMNPEYFIEELNYLVPFEEKKPRKYEKQLLDYRFVYASNEISTDIQKIEEKYLRIRKKKRKPIIKIKVRRTYWK